MMLKQTFRPMAQQSRSTITSAPVLPRFARQLQRTKILVRQASPAAGPDYAPTVVTG